MAAWHLKGPLYSRQSLAVSDTTQARLAGRQGRQFYPLQLQNSNFHSSQHAIAGVRHLQSTVGTGEYQAGTKAEVESQCRQTGVFAALEKFTLRGQVQAGEPKHQFKKTFFRGAGSFQYLDGVVSEIGPGHEKLRNIVDLPA